jgi:hypothetical protein
VLILARRPRLSTGTGSLPGQLRPLAMVFCLICSVAESFKIGNTDSAGYVAALVDRYQASIPSAASRGTGTRFTVRLLIGTAVPTNPRPMEAP